MAMSTKDTSRLARTTAETFAGKRKEPRLSVLAPTRYPWRFNSPRESRHAIENRNFIPMNYISPKLEGITMFSPFPLKRFDLVHAFNRIPLGTTPFIISFESHMPRGFGIENSRFYRFMTNRLANDRCLGIGAISEHARRIFLKTHRNSADYETLRRKLFVRYPNMVIEERDDGYDSADRGPIRVVFVGNHFGRKGGCVGLRLAELALERNLPVEVSIVSSMEMGAVSWTDPLLPGYFDRYRQLLSLPNVRHHQNIPNAQVLKILRKAHFSLLTTFCDTFGFSAIESMANYVPVIATRQGALPEFIKHRQNGLMLGMETNEIGEWKHIADDRSTTEFAEVHAREIERLAEESLAEITAIMADRNGYQALRKAAYMTARTTFSASDANDFWDDYYVEALSRYKAGHNAFRLQHKPF
ncbi:glycosyltransferase family 4 protein [Rhizobium paknamense]|uniref:Glycosyltransferase involved in cell wall biosynthesis n=1 Tax=Rhizobium paknamense TaxID=1206817 RepID=A0ABU0IFW9_9HYPH|nr:glycosyltransferase family 4 protein [Rhizobium paknamense]MDQ0457157.1 glycosyltransferase involved in cell wall biosynthesis [Rhizobium paknamense]